MESIDYVFENIPIPDCPSQFGEWRKTAEVDAIERFRPHAAHYEIELPGLGIDVLLSDVFSHIMKSLKSYFSILEIHLQEPINEHEEHLDYNTFFMKIDEDSSLLLTLDLNKKFLTVSARSFSRDEFKNIKAITEMYCCDLKDYVDTRRTSAVPL